MNKLILILTLFLFSLTVGLKAQEKIPVIKSNSKTVTLKDGENLWKNAWNLTPEAKPDVYEAQLIDGKPHKVTFITDVDSISFDVEVGKKYDFIIQHGDEKCYTQIVGIKFVPAAIFDKKYQASHKGKIFAEVPEVYELVNIAIALTPTGIADKNLIYQKSDYYKQIRAWFDKYRNHPLISAFEAEMKANQYFYLKMNGNSFVFDKKGKIVQSPIYNRTSWGNNNKLTPFLEQLQSFADTTNFRQFYKQNRKTYEEQIIFFEKTADIGEMKRWLDKNFPSSNNYDTYKIIFSPLVGYNQSAIWFESNGFKELQPHVNFPYLEDFGNYTKAENLSKKTTDIFRAHIVFTEVNHGYINPEAEKYTDKISRAMSNRDFWVDRKTGENYPNIATFEEYINWTLVTLFITDHVPPTEQKELIAGVEEMMTKNRGFRQFAKFDKFLINLYKNRQPNQTLADLYPQIIEWFAQNNQTK